VEHDAEVIWATVMSTSRRVLQQLGETKRMAAAIGITNQRETTILWDRRSGAPIYNAIVWQDRRTADRCRELARDHDERELSLKTGLRFDPYSRRPRSPGFWTACPVRARPRRQATLLSVPWIAFSFGG